MKRATSSKGTTKPRTKNASRWGPAELKLRRGQATRSRLEAGRRGQGARSRIKKTATNRLASKPRQVKASPWGLEELMLFARPTQDGRKAVLRNFELLKKANRAEELFGIEIENTVETVGEPPAGCGNGDGTGAQEAPKRLLEPEVLEPVAVVPQLPVLATLHPAPPHPGGATWWVRIRSILKMEWTR